MIQPSLIEAWDNIFNEIEYHDVYNSTFVPVESVDKFNRIVKRHKANLSLGDFIPCDKDGKPLKEPDTVPFIDSDEDYQMIEYQQALDRVIYAGWELDDVGERYICLINKDDTAHFFFWENGSIEYCDDTMDMEKEIKTRNDMTGFELTETGSKIYK